MRRPCQLAPSPHRLPPSHCWPAQTPIAPPTSTWLPRALPSLNHDDPEHAPGHRREGSRPGAHDRNRRSIVRPARHTQRAKFDVVRSARLYLATSPSDSLAMPLRTGRRRTGRGCCQGVLNAGRERSALRRASMCVDPSRLATCVGCQYHSKAAPQQARHGGNGPDGWSGGRSAQARASGLHGPGGSCSASTMPYSP